MKKTLFQVFALACALAAVAAVPVGADSPAAAPAELAGYKQWTRLNAEPIVVDSAWVGG